MSKISYLIRKVQDHLYGVHGVLHDHEGVVVRQVPELQAVLQGALELRVVGDGAAQHHLNKRVKRQNHQRKLCS